MRQSEIDRESLLAPNVEVTRQKSVRSRQHSTMHYLNNSEEVLSSEENKKNSSKPMTKRWPCDVQKLLHMRRRSWKSNVHHKNSSPGVLSQRAYRSSEVGGSAT